MRNEVASNFRAIVLAAAARTQVRQAVLDVYAAVQREIDTRRPLCSISGRCCRFEEYGHRLYVTTIELAAFIHDLTATVDPAWNGQGCPFQANKLCGVHAIRPFGCRMFFCDPTAAQWQNDLYERFHGQLKSLHESLNVPYQYLEWRSALSAMGITNSDNL